MLFILFCYTVSLKGDIGEHKVKAKLKTLGFRYGSPFLRSCDLIVDNARVEIKYALPNAKGSWVVNIHRHNLVKEDQVDAYVFCLDGVPGSDRTPLYLIYRAPLGVPTMSYSFSSLLRNHYAAIDDWDTLRTVCNEATQNISLDTAVKLFHSTEGKKHKSKKNRKAFSVYRRESDSAPTIFKAEFHTADEAHNWIKEQTGGFYSVRKE